ncbi:MAG: glycosyltransferase [Thermoanaerobaculia bacterium]|nr:glycosyltransferase [Thermoanaerobaculia bacterium]
MKPSISVIIPTFSRREDLQRTLAGYVAQEPAELSFEVIVVDDGSADDTWGLLDQFRSERFNLISQRQDNQGPAAARNRALALASGDIILFTGDDIVPAPDLLARHLAAHAERPDPGTAILGQIQWPDDLEQTATMRHIAGPGAEQFSYYYMKDGAEYDFRHLYTSNISLHRVLLDTEPEYFSTDFPAAAFEDAELAYRLVPHGLRIYYEASALAYHYHRYTARSFFDRQVRCGRMATLLIHKSPETQPLLGVSDVERTRRWVRWGLHLRRRTHDRRVRELEGRLDRALAKAERLDDRNDEVETTPNPLLLSLFRYGYLRGVTERSCSPALVEPVSAELFRKTVEPVLS